MPDLNQTEREELEKLREEKKNKSTLHCKVSQKGACSLYGLGRFPVTLYKEQWQKVFDFIESIKSFVAEHDGELKSK